MSIDPDKLHIIRSKPKHDSHSDAIRQFEGEFECLSNTYKCPVSLRGDPEPYPSVEHALQASKTGDPELKESIRQAKNAIEAKKIARVIKPTPEWRAGSEKTVEALVRDKFRRNAKARQILIGTGRVKLVYTNTHDDRVWGVCGGKGDNKLGKLLERVRADALAGKDTDVWCAMRFELAAPLDVAVDFAVTKAGQVVAELSFEGKPVIRMGKLPDNEVVMAHPAVSRSHALLVVDRKLGAFLVDLGTSNGSFVDGRRITPYVPEPIEAGGAALTFAKSKRTYTLTRVETNLREAKKSQLYKNMSDPTASVGQPEPDSTVYVGNLASSVTEDDLREFFADCGAIASIRIPQDKDTGKMRGIAFVAFTKHTGVLHALTLHMDDLKGESVKVRRADAKTDSNKTQKNPPARPRGVDGDNTAPKAARSGGRREEGASAGRLGGGGSGNGAGQMGGPGQSSALELATAAIIRAAEASRANAAVAATAAGAAGLANGGEGHGGPKRRKLGEASFEMSATGGEGAGVDRRRKRGSRWGDSGGISSASATAMVTDVDSADATMGKRDGGERKGEQHHRGVPGKDRGVSQEGHRDTGKRGGTDRDNGRNDGNRRGDDGRRERNTGGRGEARRQGSLHGNYNSDDRARECGSASGGGSGNRKADKYRDSESPERHSSARSKHKQHDENVDDGYRERDNSDRDGRSREGEDRQRDGRTRRERGSRDGPERRSEETGRRGSRRGSGGGDRAGGEAGRRDVTHEGGKERDGGWRRTNEENRERRGGRDRDRRSGRRGERSISRSNSRSRSRGRR